MPNFNPQYKRSYSHTLTVKSSDIDDLGHVNNVIYLKWVQDAAEAHWNALASPTLRATYAWVVLRHEIDYLHPAMPGNTIQAITWVENYRGVKSERIVQLYLGDTGKLLAEAKTTWCLLDAAKKRPHRIEADILDVFGPELNNGFSNG